MIAGLPLAVVDIGSNSARLVIFQVTLGGHVEVLRDARAPLRLARETEGGALSEGALDRTLRALGDFRALIDGAEAERTLAVATSAVRESSNSAELISRARDELGLEIDVIDGEAEARYAFLGAVYGLPIDNGYLIDVGGGSLEVTHFRDRSLTESWTLPLGALRVSDHFLVGDPPAAEELKLLTKFVDEAIRDAGIPPMKKDEVLAGTGGTIRNLAKIDRATQAYAIHRLHGYVIKGKAVAGMVEQLARASLEQRASIPGLNNDRADSIVGGTVIVERVMNALEAPQLHVSGCGLREGLVLSQAFEDQLPPAEQVRRVSVFALAGRFAGWAPNSAARKAQIATSLLEAAAPDAPADIKEAVTHAAHLLDVGRNIDYYNRHEHTADIVAMSDLEGFSHRDIALLSALIRQVGRESLALKPYRPLLDDDDRPWLAKAGTALALADEIEARLPPSAGEVIWEVDGREIRLASPVASSWRPRALGSRFRRAFDARLVLTEDESS